MSDKTVSFETDIKPIFAQYKERMMWRFDLTDYNAVKDNATTIREYINPYRDRQGNLQPPPMPPAPFPPLSQEFRDTFDCWIQSKCKP